jgi:hypothetical protein
MRVEKRIIIGGNRLTLMRNIRRAVVPIKIHNKDYWTVAERVDKFREDHPTWTILTELISADDDTVVFKASIAGDEGVIISTGFAEEDRHASAINKSSALEVCETSAVGRALAFYGLAGTEIASADEVAGAISQQKIGEATERLISHNVKWREYDATLLSIRQHCYDGNLSAAWEEWNEIPQDDQRILKIAPTKGGWMDKAVKDGLAQAAKDDFDPVKGVYKSIAKRNET